MRKNPKLLFLWGIVLLCFSCESPLTPTISTEYTINFDKNDVAATGTTDPQTLPSGTLARLGNCGFTKPGSVFVGWATSPDGPVVYLNGAEYLMGSSHVTLYARWAIGGPKIVFEKNDPTATGTMSSQTFGIGVPTKLLPNKFSRRFYTFTGWSTSPMGTVAFADQASYTIGTSDIIFYAQWALSPSTIIPDSNANFSQAENNKAIGLFWYKKSNFNYSGKALFDSRKPTMVYIHGLSPDDDGGLKSNTNNAFNNYGNFDGLLEQWNTAIYNWRDQNNPDGGYYVKSLDLANQVTSIIDAQSLNYTEIRLVSYSWGIHVAARAGKRILEHCRGRNLKILVTIDFLDPVPDYGVHTESMKNDLVYLVNNQTAALKSGKKLIGLNVRRQYGNDNLNYGYLFATVILPAINRHVKAAVTGANHASPLGAYLNQTDYTGVRFDGASWTSGYTEGPTLVELDYIEASNWTTDKGPVIETAWDWRQHYWQEWYWGTPAENRWEYWYTWDNGYYKPWVWPLEWVSVWKDEYHWVWHEASNWTYRWVPYAWKDWTLLNKVWNFMNS